MSAFIVSEEHIAALVLEGADSYWFWNGETQRESPSGIGQMLWEENHRSVNYRYREDTPTPVYRHVGSKPYKAVERLKLLSSYVYQSCEHPEWETSRAKAYCDMLQNALIHELPGYSAAEWVV
jgi:hypothetical protein